MDERKIIPAVGYFSAFFAPILIPIIIYFVFKDDKIRSHAKSALLLHIIPTVLTLWIIISTISKVFTFDVGFGTIGLILLVIIIDIVMYIWNLVKGIMVLIK